MSEIQTVQERKATDGRSIYLVNIPSQDVIAKTLKALIDLKIAEKAKSQVTANDS